MDGHTIWDLNQPSQCRAKNLGLTWQRLQNDLGDLGHHGRYPSNFTTLWLFNIAMENYGPYS